MEIAGLSYTDDLALCGESEEDLKVMVKACGRIGLEVNAGDGTEWRGGIGA